MMVMVVSTPETTGKVFPKPGTEFTQTDVEKLQRILTEEGFNAVVSLVEVVGENN